MAQMQQALTTGFQSSVFVTEFDTFRREILTSRNGTKKKKKHQFIEEVETLAAKHTGDVLQRSVDEAVAKCSSGRLRRICLSIRPVVDAFKDYTGVIDTMAQTYPVPTCFIWGSLKIVVECIARYNEQFDTIKSELARLPELLWDLSNFEDLYGTSMYAANAAQRIMSRTYQTILWFLYHCTKTLKHSVLSALRHDSKLSALATDLETHRSDLATIRSAAEGKLNQTMRDKIAGEAKLDEDMRREIRNEFVKAELERCAAELYRKAAELETEKAELERQAARTERLKAEEDRGLAERERAAQQAERDQSHKFRVDDSESKERRKWTDLISQLEGHNEVNFSLRDTILEERHPKTCQWLFEHDKFTTWAAEQTNTPVFWLHGKHGAGKSFLCASAIEALSKRPNPQPIVYQFFRKEEYVSRNQLLRNLACQLVHHLNARTLKFPTTLDPFLKGVKSDSAAIERLIRAVLQELPFTFILIDGLDEVEFTKEQALAPMNAKVSEFNVFMTFLMGCATENPGTIRLWCSSQPSHEWQAFFCHDKWKEYIVQHPISLQDTANDIKRYLNAGVEDSIVDKVDKAENTLASMMLKTAMATEVEGSFLWASSMLKDLIKRVEDADDIRELIREGLPKTLSDVYTKVINHIKDRDISNKKLPLWKIVLSLLTFAQRALKVSEVIEAVAMIRTPKDHDLSRNKIVDVSKILDTCMSLVRIVKTSETPDADGHLLLSHSALTTFLRKKSDIAQTPLDDAEQLVSSKIVRDCCLRYLMQPRYSRLFKPEGMNWTQTDVGESLKSHKLVSYAAKYWSADSSNPPESEEKSSDVIGFLRSSNFWTCIQIQSLFVVGHFLQSIDPITDRATFTHRNLPMWLILQHPTMHRQYLDFVTEWCEVLQLGLLAPFYGEVDRCLWGALGAANFLSKNKCRYASYQLHDTIPYTEEKVRRVQWLSADGTRLKMCVLKTTSDTTQMVSEDWTIDGVGPPTRTEQTVFPAPIEISDMDLYALPCSISSPLIPSSSCIGSPDLVTLHPEACVTRIGSKIFNHSPKHTSLLSHLSEQNDGPWEDIRIVGNFLVVSRRRTRKKAPSDEALAKEERRLKSMRSRKKAFDMIRGTAENTNRGDSSSSSSEFDLQSSSSGRSSMDQTSDNSEDDSSSDDGSLESAPVSSSDEAGSLDLAHLSSAEESWSEGSTDTEDLPDSLSSSPKSVGSIDEDNDKDEDDEVDIDSKSASIANDSDSESFSSLKSGIQNLEQSDSDSLESIASLSRFMEDSDMSDSDLESTASDISFSAIEPELGAADTQHPVRIAKSYTTVDCDTCNKSKQRWLHCSHCNDNNFDICHDCKRRGRWCFDQAHQLYDMVEAKAIGVMSRNKNFRLRQELNIYRLDTDSTTPIFHVRKKYDAMLYGSAPAIHPNQSLVVWPLTGSQLLFGDIAGNHFFEQKTKIISKRARPICVDLSFSPCGSQLRVATIDATLKIPDHKSKAGAEKSPANLTILLNLHLLVLQLSSSKPAKVPPKLITSASHCLGPCTSKLIQDLPFAFCWGTSDLHLTVSDSRLRVYRVTFPEIVDAGGNVVQAATFDSGVHLNPSGPILTPLSKQIRILTPSSTIFLPRSARMRSVKFFPPAKAGANSTVIIGPRNCGSQKSSQSSSICLYLSDADLGGWIVPDPVEGESLAARQRLEGLYEDWDKDRDCDIIPFY